MIYSTLLAATGTIPLTSSWSPAIGAVMIICNVIAIAIGKTTMANPGVGTALPMPEMFGGMGWPGLLATTSLGHIIGILTIVLLSSYGIL
jgi:photosystem I subunit 10